MCLLTGFYVSRVERISSPSLLPLLEQKRERERAFGASLPDPGTWFDGRIIYGTRRGAQRAAPLLRSEVFADEGAKDVGGKARCVGLFI